MKPRSEMTPEELAAFRARQAEHERNRRAKMTPEQREARRIAVAKWRAARTPEEKAAALERARAKPMSDERREKQREHNRKYREKHGAKSRAPRAAKAAAAKVVRALEPVDLVVGTPVGGTSSPGECVGEYTPPPVIQLVAAPNPRPVPYRWQERRLSYAEREEPVILFD